MGRCAVEWNYSIVILISQVHGSALPPGVGIGEFRLSSLFDSEARRLSYARAARGIVDGSGAIERVRDSREMARPRPMPIAHEGHAQKT
jgi:hypothetical protein